MAFTDHKITQFEHRIADLADQPNLPPDELKTRFDSSPEELRQAVNALCDDADRLDARVSGIITETFGDSIDKSMLSDELAAELDAKAIETSVAERLAAEAETRENADAALDTRLTAAETALPQKCEVLIGSYVGNGSDNRFINLERTPAAVILCEDNSTILDGRYVYGGIALQGFSAPGISITEGGFTVRQDNENLNCNYASFGNPRTYYYIAFVV